GAATLAVAAQSEAVPGDAGAGQGASDAAVGAVREDDRLPEQPAGAAAADEQSCGEDEPTTALPGESALQVAAAADDRSFPGAGLRALAATPGQPRPAESGGASAGQPGHASVTRSEQRPINYSPNASTAYLMLSCPARSIGKTGKWCV